MDTTDIRKLLYKLSLGSVTSEELEVLRKWASGRNSRVELLERLGNPEYVAAQMKHRRMVRTERPCADMKRRIRVENTKAAARRIVKVACCVALVAAVCLTWFLSQDDAASRFRDAGTGKESSVGASAGINGITPGSTKATLISENGKTVSLGASDAASMIETIVPQITEEQPGHIENLCLAVPRGGEFKIILEDSTEVWLNSDSRLRYPRVFDEKERRVEVEGEAYFLVKKDKTRPFYVDTKDMTVQVYGTSFNIKAYDDEEYTCTTLEKGSVSVSADGVGGELLLSPGHQAMLSHDSGKVNMRVVDPEEISAWHKGRFVLENKTLKEIMRDLSRWYDFKYRFEDKSLEDIVFMGSIPRYENFSSAQHILEQSGDIRLRMKGDCVIISSK